MPKRIDNRTGDRHKSPRPGDRHKPRTGDRHSPGYVSPNAKEKKPWEGRFVAFDGEGWDGKYMIFACSAMPYDLYDPEGLTTKMCLKYMTDYRIRGGDACVGYGLSYDFENILADVPDDDYKLLLQGEKINFHEYTIKYIPRKFLEVTKNSGRLDAKGNEYKKTIFLQDILGFFQSTFEKALEKWEIEIPEIIKIGKALRGDFNKQPVEFIKKYNREELRLMVEMMDKLRDADKDAFEPIGLQANHTPRIWYGPGSRASNFLRQTNWVEEHPEFTGEAMENFRAEVLNYFPHDSDGSPALQSDKEILEYENIKKYPFAAAFFGGRIEAAALGTFKCKLWDNDINSAYPFAISNLPKWRPEDLIEVKGWDKADRIGIYRVKWECPPGINFYPFPYRSKSGNVFYPPSGEGWYMSPEVDAALDVYGPECVKVIKGYVLKDTDGAGNGLVKLPGEKLCTTAKKMDLMAASRLIAKAKKQPKEKTIKLVMNSGYGKTIQQIGSHKFLNPFAASWITSTCRAIISRAIGADTENNIISIMTDGILTRKELPVKLGKLLGEFDQKDFDFAIQFMPGVYLLENSKTGEKVPRYRGMDKNFDARAAVKILNKKIIHRKPTKTDPGRKSGFYKIDINIFVTRTLALHQPKKFGELRYHFLPVTKEEEFSLKSKRTQGPKGFRLMAKEENRFFPPKYANPMEVKFFGSKPYVLDLPAELAYDEAETEEEMLSNARLTSALDIMNYDLLEG